MSFRKYAEYKESGVEWLGEIPYGWDLKPLKYVSHINTHTLPEGTDPGYEFDYVDIGSVSDGSGITKTERMKFASAPSRARRLVQKGDVIISTVRTYLRAIAPITRDAENLVVSTGFCVVSPINELKSEYCLYLLQAPFFVETVVAQSVGVSYPATNASDIANIRIPIPNVEEQKRIAAFLDKETIKIDTLIDKQEQLITLLREKRQAIISHAVTRGLNPNAKMKDSGIEWLGEVPEHWEVKKLKHIVTKPLMYGANEAAIDDDRDQPRFVRITDIRNNGTLREDTFRSLPWHLAKSYMLREGDVLLARSGATVGKSFIYSSDWGECCFAGYLIKASIDISKASPHWFYRYTESDYYWNWISSTLIQATIQNVSAEKYNNFFLCIPPKQEQERIIAYLDKETTKIDTLIEKCETAIELLKERRTALISAAVTGKIDVRSAG